MLPLPDHLALRPRGQIAAELTLEQVTVRPAARLFHEGYVAARFHET
jgi:hypothetical protein